jgi:N-acetylneuraminic acid mutarotase
MIDLRRQGRLLTRLWLLLALTACRSDEAVTPPTPSAGDAWSSRAPMNEPRQEVGVAELGGRIYVAGGFRGDRRSTTTVEAYDPATNLWSFVAPLPVALDHCAAVATAGRLYVVGGTAPTGPSAGTFEYDPLRNAWAVKAPMPTPRSAPAAVVIGGRIYVAGGAPEGRALEAYDPAADAWTRLPPMPTSRNHLAAGAVGTRLLAVGGRPPTTLAVLEAFDTATGAWSTLAPMPTGRSGHAAAVVRGCLYVFGGEGNAASPSGVFPQTEAYDPRSDTWVGLAPMPTPRHGIGAGVLGDAIHVPAGAGVQGFGVAAAHEVFTPSGRACQ